MANHAAGRLTAKSFAGRSRCAEPVEAPTSRCRIAWFLEVGRVVRGKAGWKDVVTRNKGQARSTRRIGEDTSSRSVDGHVSGTD